MPVNLFNRLRASLQLARARRARRRGAGNEALRHALAALQLRPGWAEAHNSAGIELYEMTRLYEAIAQFRLALAADPHYASAHVNLGNALIDSGQMDAALTHYRRAIELDPRDATAHLTLAMALEDDGNHDGALASYQRAQALAPGDGIRIKIATMLPMFPASAQEIDVLRERLQQGIAELLSGPLRLRDPARE